MSESETEVDEVLDEKRSIAPMKFTVKNMRSLLKVCEKVIHLNILSHYCT